MKQVPDAQVKQIKDAVDELTSLAKKLSEQHVAIESGIERYNELVQKYNNVLHSVNTIRGELNSEMDNYINNKPDGWLETEAGGEYQEWYDEWEGLDLLEIEILDIPEPPETEHATAITGMSLKF